jgi:hypothetical protein
MFPHQVDAFHSLDPIWIFRVIYDLLTSGGNGSLSVAARAHDSWSLFWQNLPYYAINIFARYAVFSLFLCIALAIVVALYARKVFVIRKKIESKILPVSGVESLEGDEKQKTNPKWQLVQKHIDSANQSDWKLAILEADIMLSELLEGLSLPGDSIGERLKAVEESDFDTIEQAWEAHKIRNAIAHEGSDFLITQREAKRIIGLYQEVFNEFEMI